MQRWKDSSTIVNALMLPAKPSSYGPSTYSLITKHIQFLGENGEDACYVRKFGSTPLCIMFLHGNYTDIGELDYSFAVEVAAKLKCTLIAPEYPGYGLSQGMVGEAACIRAAFQAVQFALKNLGFLPSQFVVFGQSIGTGVGIQVAKRMQDKLSHVPLAVLLLSPMMSVKDIAKGFTFFGNFIANRFNSIGTLPKLQLQNLLLVHGTKDDVIPHTHSLKLIDASKHIPNHNLELIDNATHNQFPRTLSSIFVNFINGFLTKAPGIDAFFITRPKKSSLFSSFGSSSSSLTSSNSADPIAPTSTSTPTPTSSSSQSSSSPTSSQQQRLELTEVIVTSLDRETISTRFEQQIEYVKTRNAALDKYEKMANFIANTIS